MARRILEAALLLAPFGPFKRGHLTWPDLGAVDWLEAIGVLEQVPGEQLWRVREGGEAAIRCRLEALGPASDEPEENPSS